MAPEVWHLRYGAAWREITTTCISYSFHTPKTVVGMFMVRKMELCILLGWLREHKT